MKQSCILHVKLGVGREMDFHFSPWFQIDQNRLFEATNYRVKDQIVARVLPTRD